jgi:hypothetical protein
MGSDIVTMAVVNGKPRLEDRFAVWTAFDVASNTVTPTTPKVDACSNYDVICASEVDGYTEFMVKRLLDTGDKEDRVIAPGPMVLIYSWGESDTVAYHGANRGNLPISVIGAAVPSFTVPADVNANQNILMNNYAMKTTRTQYVLQKVDIGTTTSHIVAVEVIIPTVDAPFVRTFRVVGKVQVALTPKLPDRPYVAS